MSARPAPQPRRAPSPRRARVRFPRSDRFLRLLQRVLNAWRVLHSWLQGNSFAPRWLPRPWRRALIGASVSVLLAGGAMGLTLLLMSTLPVFVLPGMLPLLGVVIVALTWGAAPSLLATLTSTALLELVVLPHYFPMGRQPGVAAIHAGLFGLVGISISLLSSQSGRARRRAEALARALGAEKASSDLERLRLRALVDTLPAPVALVDAQERVLEYNPAVQCLFWGEAAPVPREIADWQGAKAWWPATGQSVSPREWPIARAALTGERVTNEEIEIETPDGQRKLVLDSATPIRDECGVLQGAVGVLQDITEHKRLEEALCQAEQNAEARARELEAIFETLADGVLVYDGEGRILRANPAASQIWGWAAQPGFASRSLPERLARYVPIDAQGQPLPADALPLPCILRGEVLTGTHTVDVRVAAFDGVERIVNLAGTPLRTAEGAIVGAVGIARDVTERRRLEREVAERAAQLAAIFESVADGLVVTDAQGRMLQLNQALRTLLGIDLDPTGRTRLQLEELADYAAYTTAGERLREGEDPISMALQGQVLTSEQSVTLLFRTRDGREIWTNGTSAPIRDQRGQVIGCVGVIRDVTAQRHQEQQTRDTLNALLAMAEALVQAPEQGSAASASGAPKTNHVARRLAELTRNVLECRYVGIAAVEPGTEKMTPITIVGVSPQQEQQWWASWGEHSRLGQHLPPSEVAALHAGEPVLVTSVQTPFPRGRDLVPGGPSVLVPMRIGDTLVGLLRVEEGTTEEAYRRPNRKVLINAVARLGALVLERERLQCEGEEARANELAIRQTQAQMETFLGIAGHELKNPLTSIKLALQLLERRLRRRTQRESDGPQDLAPFLREVAQAEHQAARLERLVNELLDVSRVRAGKLELHLQPTDLAALVREAVDEQRKVHPERALVFQLPPERPVPVVADADRLGQVVTNYLTNALKYSPAARPVAVGLDVEEQQARVWVRDQGPGLPPEEQERIWERFHRVPGIPVQSGTGVGLGLGLHICRMIVERHQGQVGVESAPGQGSTFWFIVPLERQG